VGVAAKTATNPIVMKKILLPFQLLRKIKKLLSTEKDAIKFNPFIPLLQQEGGKTTGTN